MTAPTFSVVICTYNRADRVTRAIKSVLGQTFEDFELLVVDDGSVDHTRRVVAAVDDPRLRYIARDNGGLSAARNTGVGASWGRYVTFLDDDDEALPRWLETFRGALGGRHAVVSCGVLAVDEKGQVVATLSPRPLGPELEGYRGLFLSGSFALPRTVYDAVGGFAEDLRIRHHAEFALRLLPYCRSSECPVEVVEEPLVRYETRASEHRAAIMPANVLAASDYLFARYKRQLLRSPEMFANWLAMAGVAAARLGRYAEARRFFARAARAQPSQLKHLVRLGVALVPPLGDAVWNARRYRQASAPLTAGRT